MSAKIIVIDHLSLDGVYQAPGAADEDTRGNFRHGGWSARHDDIETQKAVGEHMAGGWSLLAGGTTYDGLYQAWGVKQPSTQMGKALTAVEKFLATRNPNRETPWANTTRLAGEARDTVGQLKAERDVPLVVFGSGQLVLGLLYARLVDQMLLMTHPLVLGEGLRFFGDGDFSEFRLVNSNTTKTGVIIANYELER